MQMILAVLAYVAAAAAVVALIACAVRRWQLAASVSRVVVFGGASIALASAAVSIVVPLSGMSDAFAVLSRGMPEVMQTGGVALAASLLAIPVRAVARSRIAP